jgi:uncharacterized peroxidase-related enzyme
MDGVPHIELPDLPGMAGLMAQYPRTAGPLNDLGNALLRGPSPLSPAERETIAAYVSARNECTYCAEIHGAVARHLHRAADGPDSDGGGGNAVDEAIRGGENAAVGPKMQALLALADRVRVDGRSVTTADVERARAAGADDQTIHDTVLIAAAFSMFNRYVDGLATLVPDQPDAYARHAVRLAEHGYAAPPTGQRSASPAT